jgi:hypothetical protein
MLRLVQHGCDHSTCTGTRREHFRQLVQGELQRVNEVTPTAFFACLWYSQAFTFLTNFVAAFSSKVFGRHFRVWTGFMDKSRVNWSGPWVVHVGESGILIWKDCQSSVSSLSSLESSETLVDGVTLGLENCQLSPSVDIPASARGARN